MNHVTCRRCGEPVPEDSALWITAIGKRAGKPICPRCHEDEVCGRGEGRNGPVKSIRRRANWADVNHDMDRMDLLR